MSNKKVILEKAANIPTWLAEDEKVRLIELAMEVALGKLIVEIGSLYGGSTALLALAAPKAKVIAIDNFSWSPITERPASQAELLRNMASCEIENVTVMEGDSRRIGFAWQGVITLLWIDGGHSYEFVRMDLGNFGPWAYKIALHDYDNPAWPSVKQAVEDFIAKYPIWEIESVVGMLVTLKRNNTPVQLIYKDEVIELS